MNLAAEEGLEDEYDQSNVEPYPAAGPGVVRGGRRLRYDLNLTPHQESQITRHVYNEDLSPMYTRADEEELRKDGIIIPEPDEPQPLANWQKHHIKRVKYNDV